MWRSTKRGSISIRAEDAVRVGATSRNPMTWLGHATDPTVGHVRAPVQTRCSMLLLISPLSSLADHRARRMVRQTKSFDGYRSRVWLNLRQHGYDRGRRGRS